MRVALVVCQHHDVCLSEAQPCGQQILHALGVVDAALQLIWASPALSRYICSAAQVKVHTSLALKMRMIETRCGGVLWSGTSEVDTGLHAAEDEVRKRLQEW